MMPVERRAFPEAQLQKWTPTEVAREYATRRFANRRRADRDPRLVATLLRRHPAPGSIARLLDVPCGTGRLRPLAEANAERVVGIDLSAAMLAAGVGPRVRASAWQLPFRDDTFDVVLCCRLLHHLREDESRLGLLRELARVARARLIVSFWDSGSLAAWRRRLGVRRATHVDERVPIARDHLRRLADRADLEPLGFAASARFLSPQTFCALRPRD